jgi:hypothetical protein
MPNVIDENAFKKANTRKIVADPVFEGLAVGEGNEAYDDLPN